jgi:molecular chaperone HtpG
MVRANPTLRCLPMPEIDFDWEGLINLLAKHLYSEKRIFIREIIQNAHDAIVRRRHHQPGFGGHIDIKAEASSGTITFTDDGVGMDESSLTQFLSIVGKGETRIEKEHIEGLIGQFGIGFLSAFVVAEKVEVLTQKWSDRSGWLWVNTGSRRYEISPSSLSKPGTSVTVFVNKSELGILQGAEIRDVIKRYADMLLVPIYVNSQYSQINTGRMPWEFSNSDNETTRLACLAYLEARMRDSVLEVIPFDLSLPNCPRAQGALYISSTRVFALDAPRNVEVYLNRMFVSRDVPEILPEWASFVNGVINSSDLQPTAARDNIVRDHQFERLRRALGDLIIGHLEKLRDGDPYRFTEILRYHALRIRAACLAYEDFLEKFADLVEWKVNTTEKDEYSLGLRPKSLTLPEIIRQLTVQNPKLPLRLLSFSGGNADHFFEMANFAGTLVIDASSYFEMELLEVIAKRRPTLIRLVRVDREDAEELFRIAGGPDHPVVLLARAMSLYSHPMQSKLDVSARVFEPTSLPAILRDGEGAEERERAHRIYHDPRHSRDAREIAGALLKRPPKSLKLTINAANDFVTRLARMVNYSDESIQQLMIGLYNSSFLSSGDLTQHNARVLHADYVRLMERSLEYLETESERKSSLRIIEHERSRLAAMSGPRLAHKVFFMITPFSDSYGDIRRLMKEIVEERWHCQLFLASDRKYEDRILDSVRTHMLQADAFIAELTDANPNVMFELGAAFADRRDRPIVQLIDGSKFSGKDHPKLPADLQGMIYIDYSRCQQSAVPKVRLGPDCAELLEKEMRADVRISKLLSDSGRHRYLSAYRLQSMIKLGLISESSCRRIAEEIPTQEAWLNVTEATISRLLDDSERDSCSLLIQRVRRALQPVAVQ